MKKSAKRKAVKSVEVTAAIGAGETQGTGGGDMDNGGRMPGDPPIPGDMGNGSN